MPNRITTYAQAFNLINVQPNDFENEIKKWSWSRNDPRWTTV